MKSRDHEPARPVRTALRYAFLQLPGTLLLAVVLLAVADWLHLPRWLVWSTIALSVAKDAVLFPFVRRSYEPHSATEPHAMIGACGVARERLAPTGYVHVGNELWRAEVPEGVPPIERGRPVRVRDRHGLTLVVQPDDHKPGE